MSEDGQYDRNMYTVLTNPAKFLWLRATCVSILR